MVGDFGWEHEGTKSGVGTVNSKVIGHQSWQSKIVMSTLMVFIL